MQRTECSSPAMYDGLSRFEKLMAFQKTGTDEVADRPFSGAPGREGQSSEPGLPRRGFSEQVRQHSCKVATVQIGRANLVLPPAYSNFPDLAVTPHHPSMQY